MQQPQQQIPPQLKQAIENTPFLECKNCKSPYFDTVFMIKNVNLGVVGRIGEFLPVQMPVYRCSNCGELLTNDHGETKETIERENSEGGIIREIH